MVARGVLSKEDRILLAHKKDATNTFLPGGHIEFGKSACSELVREIREELGVEVEVKDFLGVIEHFWEDEGGLNHEINLIFRVECDQLGTDELPSSQESHLEFFWQSVNDLATAKLEPSALIELMPRWLSVKPNLGWGSTIE